ncbi:P-loop containing nucleoside triphosphate hydrolase protein [Wallemia mellicola]|uniref:Elongation factor 2 n=1 Tax=Wallemia mellicola TaxID=1708541 RepID=A0AB74KBX1_9BASI|nr:P-loop containing nucleoside triphosphate hydrolase protein [Wallemia mellicola]TIC34427.1 P-loop containing nucleoside triphosphate hydrolase protein [Wallemia mellicola]TIC41592.1 P-loop containing nucleoside triphosphate hydrolase protein [Wallemia mellicola]TIC54215.1 P-loop containing nucleoside triphosphate hydrolase protein [Wallemia mellicola]TIC60848.1 P-loop containing nucleoside triphosphate hydrolase protein [Wallemia mellicola]
MLLRPTFRLSRTLCHYSRGYKTQAWSDAARTRNVGIVAHIDGGKTTLTESLLCASGILKNRGNVDEGTTITDFLPAERERGITIQSASVPLEWRDHRINLIDTPGHADFAVEVERAVRVLDGGIVVLDAVEGVEAQTEGVWKQAKRYDLNPMILFINKMDRIGANFSHSIRSTISKMHTRPLVLQLPIFNKSGDGLDGVIDVLGDASASTPAQVLTEKQRARECLIESLCEVDSTLCDEFLAVEEYDKVSDEQINQALRRKVYKGEVLPVLCGSALKNISVDKVLDSIVNYLPSPKDVPASPTISGETYAIGDPKVSALAMAFKVVWDARKGWLTWVRVYAGSLTKQKTLWNSTNNSKERINRLLLMSADDSVEIDTLYAGQIGVLIGCKNTKTGDTLTDARDSKMTNVQLRSITIPPPVFSVAIEPESLSDEAAVSEALKSLVRSDPSLVISEAFESHAVGGDGQTLLSGLGELHLEISYRRLREEFGVRCRMGPMRVGYLETLASETSITRDEEYAREVNKKPTQAGITIEISRREEFSEDAGNNLVMDIGDLGMEYQEAVRAGMLAGTARGPTQGHPVRGLEIKVYNPRIVDKDLSPPSALTAAVSLAIVKAIRELGTSIIEPLMDVYITAYEADVGRVISDVTSIRNGIMMSMEEDSHSEGVDSASSSSVYIPPAVEASTRSFEGGDKGNRMKVHAQVPLTNMVAYSSHLNALSGGSGTFSMKVCGWKETTSSHTAVL